MSLDTEEHSLQAQPLVGGEIPYLEVAELHTQPDFGFTTISLSAHLQLLSKLNAKKGARVYLYTLIYSRLIFNLET